MGSDCSLHRSSSGQAVWLQPGSPGGCSADWFQGWRDGNLQESGKIALCQGLIQSSGIKPLARGLNWNFTSTDPLAPGSGLSWVSVWLSQRFPHAVGTGVKKESPGPHFLLLGSFSYILYLVYSYLNLSWEDNLETVKDHEGIYSQGQE